MPNFQRPPYLSAFLVNSPPPMILNRAPVEKGAHLQCLLKSPVDEPPAKFPSGAPTESDVCPLSPPPPILPDPQKRSPTVRSPKRAPTERDARFPEPSNYLLKEPSHETGEIFSHCPQSRALHRWKDYIQWGAAWFPKVIVYNTAITSAVLCGLQHDTFHLGFGRP